MDLILGLHQTQNHLWEIFLLASLRLREELGSSRVFRPLACHSSERWVHTLPPQTLLSPSRALTYSDCQDFILHLIAAPWNSLHWKFEQIIHHCLPVGEELHEESRFGSQLSSALSAAHSQRNCSWSQVVGKGWATTTAIGVPGVGFSFEFLGAQKQSFCVNSIC